MQDTHSLSHSSKYLRKVLCDQKRLEFGAILREFCRWKGINILEAEVVPIMCICCSRFHPR